MAFSNQFLSFFTTEEQNTDFVKIFNALGVNMEKTLYEILSAETTINSDINFFSGEMYSSWLGFFLQKIRNRSCAKAVVTVTIQPNDRNVRVEIPAGTTLRSTKGNYVQREALTLLPGNSATFLAYQGKQVSQTIKSYNDFIKIDANNIDLDTLVITDDEGNEVPEISYESSWAGMQYMGSVYLKTINNKSSFYIDNSKKTLTDKIGKKGQFYIVVVPQVLTAGGDLQGNKVSDENLAALNGSIVYRGSWIVFDGKHWTCSAPNNSFMPYQVSLGLGVPQNGYYAYVSGGNLFVKIFPGNDVTEPAGRTYNLSFISTDGVQGKTDEDTLEYASVLKDVDGEKVDFTIKNKKSSDALNEITRGQLNMLLRQTLFANGSLASVPEYQAWFNAQPEIGSCFVYSDFEKWVATGVNPNTGYVTVVAVRPDGTDLTDSDVAALEERLIGKKDIAFIKFLTPEKIECFFDVKFKSSTNDLQLKELITTTIESYFNTNTLRENNMSLFESLDLSKIVKRIGTQYSNEGLSIRAYHHLFAEFSEEGNIPFITHNGEKIGDAYYIVRKPDGEGKYVDDNGNFIGTEEKWFERVKGDNSDVAQIYYLDEDTLEEVVVGTRTTSGITLTVDYPCRIEAFIPMAQDGMLTIDAFENRIIEGVVESLPTMRTLIAKEDVDKGKYSTGSIKISSYTGDN